MIPGSLPGGSPRNGLPPSGGYVYRGTKRTTPAEIAAAQASGERISAALAAAAGAPAHGTYAGYHRHRRHCEQPCEPCRQAMIDYTRRRHQARRDAARTRDVPASCTCGWQWEKGRWVLTGPDPHCPWHTPGS